MQLDLATKTMQKIGSNPNEAQKLVENYYVDGEILTGGQDHAGDVPVAGAFLEKRIGNPVGQQVTIPAVDKSGNEPTLYQADGVQRHGMDYVLRGMDKQIQIDQAQMQSLPAG